MMRAVFFHPHTFPRPCRAARTDISSSFSFFSSEKCLFRSDSFGFAVAPDRNLPKWIRRIFTRAIIPLFSEHQWIKSTDYLRPDYFHDARPDFSVYQHALWLRRESGFVEIENRWLYETVRAHIPYWAYTQPEQKIKFPPVSFFVRVIVCIVSSN